MDFGSTLPWASPDRKLSVTKCIYKFIITAGFVFDKRGLHREKIGISCFFICAFIVIQRVTHGLIYNRSIFTATLFYEVLTTWLTLTISVHTFAQAEITILELLVILFLALITTVALAFIQEIKRYKFLKKEEPIESLSTPKDYKHYLFELYHLIDTRI